MFINSGFENVPCTCISIKRKNHETVIQEIDKFEIDSHLKRKAYWKIISEAECFAEYTSTLKFWSQM